ncbi:MAG: hypothetical protein ACLFWR_13785 [Acidimicrobiales bacterium]
MAGYTTPMWDEIADIALLLHELAMVHPMVRALGYIDEVVRRGGLSAQRDLRRSASPMAVAGRLARLLRRRRRSAPA